MNEQMNSEELGLLEQDSSKLSKEQKSMMDFFIKNPDIAASRLVMRNDKPLRLAIHQRLILKGMWNHQFNLLILTRGGGKTFLLGLYLILKGALIPREKCVIASASYRQAQFTFDEIIKFYNESPLIRQATTKAPTKGPNACEMHLANGSQIIAYPLGDGQKIRGARGNSLVIDEVAQVPKYIIDTVIRPMLNVKQDPWDTSGRKNHLIMASSAYYQFNHLYQMYLDYVDRTNKKHPKYDEAYGLHVYTVDDMPNGWMDKKVIEQARETMTEIEYAMEYGCFTGDSIVTTDSGFKPISHLAVGDNVLTHKGNIKKVLETSKRKYNGNLLEIEFFGTYKKIKCTPEHPFYIFRDGEYKWEHAMNLVDSDFVIKPLHKPRVKQDKILLSDFVDINYLFMIDDGKKYIYPTPSQFKGDSKKQQRVGKPLIKSAIANEIKIDEAFMRLCGYYIAEGCSSTNNQRSISFSFNENENDYISQVVDDLKSVFGVDAKLYHVTNNHCVNVYVNSRVISNFFGNFLGKSHFDKFINEVLFTQDKELLVHLVRSLWNGDGCLNHSDDMRKPFATYGTTSERLINDIYRLLTLLGIPSSIRHRKRVSDSIIDGRKIVSNKNGIYVCNLQGENARELFKLFNVEIREADKRFSKNKIDVDVSNGAVLNKVRKVTLIEESECYVYNCEVEDDNSYCVSDIAVHNCVFVPDSDGFFPASLMRGAMKPSALIELEGEKGAQYVFGIDPAREGDNFALVVVKLGRPNKVVACFALHQNTFPQMHEFIRSKVRDYERNGGEVVRIQMDMGGGGKTIKDYLAEEYAWYNSEKQQWETMPAIIDMDDEEQKFMSGRRILKMQVFSSQTINSMNFDLRSDIEKKQIVIPSQPPKEGEEFINTFEEIDSMISETMTIVTTPLKNGLMHFDTPKQRMKKDRYSAFLCAAEGARDLQRIEVGPPVPRLAKGFRQKSFINGR